MNTTLKEIIYNLKNLRQAGKQSQDELLSDSQYAFIVDYYRSVLIKQEYNKKKLTNPIYEQSLIVEFERQRGLETDIFKDLRVFKADSTKLPRVVQLDYRPYYTGVRASLLSSSITRSSSTNIKNDLRSPHTGRFARYFPLGDDLYVVTPDPIQKLFVSGIFERPFEVWKLNPKFDPFDPYNFEYPISLHVLDTLYKMMTQGEIQFALLMPNDIDADGKPEDVKQVPRSATTPTKDSDD